MHTRWNFWIYRNRENTIGIEVSYFEQSFDDMYIFTFEFIEDEFDGYTKQYYGCQARI